MTGREKILVVDDKPSNVKALRVKLADAGYDIIEATSGGEALDRIESHAPDLVLLDVMMPGMDGYDACRRIKSRASDDFLPVILVTAKTDTDDLVEGFESGADDYVTKPFKPVEILARVRAMLRIRSMVQENRYLRAELARCPRGESIVGESREMNRVLELVEKVSGRNVTVLLTGETGTGKEAVARLIHEGGPRSRGKFVAANCGALTETLLESELFGHKKGSFSGAIEDRAGLFESANGGTVFLDEVGEMSGAMQVKLLRVLEESEVTRVGETGPRAIDVRVIAATNKDLEAETQGRRFREDLYYRLSVFPIVLPPLRERRDDIPLLARHFLDMYCRAFVQDCPGFSTEALRALSAHDWPGNVRELANEIQRALVLTPPGEEIGPQALSRKIEGGGGRGGQTPAQSGQRDGRLRDAVEALERDLIRKAFERHQGNKTHMARDLGISRWTLLQKMRVYGIEAE
jgi:DNA-binding NtrC family response regulator